MSSIQTGLNPIDLAGGEIPADEAPPRSFAAQVARDALRPLSAKLGLAWIAVIAICAVFAPFLANSFPILAKIDNHWSSPLLKHLSWADAALLASPVAAIVVLKRLRVSLFRRLLFAAAAAAVMAFVCGLFIRPPENVVYEEIRDAAAAGRVQSALYPPIPFSASDRLRDHPEVRLTPPSRAHLMGTEVNGADVLSRMIHACRIAMAMGFISTGIAIAIGIIAGGIMGYFVGPIDLIGMRLIEIFEAIPTLFLMITIVAFFPGESYRLYLLMAIIGVTSWTGYARFLRGEFLSLRKQDFVQSAIAAGLPLRRVIFRHMLPNGITPIIISASFGVASAIISESTLSFLDLGLIDQPSWGQMLSQGIGAGGNFLWWMALYPGLAIFLTVFAYNMIGEGLADALDPRRRK